MLTRFGSAVLAYCSEFEQQDMAGLRLSVVAVVVGLLRRTLAAVATLAEGLQVVHRDEQCPVSLVRCDMVAVTALASWPAAVSAHPRIAFHHCLP